MHTCKIHDLCNLVPQLWQSREAVPGLAKQRSAKIKHAAHRKYDLFDGTMTHFKPKNIACDAAVPLGEGLRA